MRRLPSPAMVVALIALAVALGGTSWAVVSLPRNSVGTKQIRQGAVRAGDVRTGAIGTRQVRDGSLQAGDLAPGTIPNLAPSPPGKAPDADLLDGKDSAAFLTAGAAAVDSARLGGRPPSDFLLADGKATDADKLDGNDSTDFGSGWVAGRITDIPQVAGGFAAAASGISSPVQVFDHTTDHSRRTLSPDRPMRVRDLVVRLPRPGPHGRQVAVMVADVPQLLCDAFPPENECVDSGPSDVIPPRSAMWVYVSGSALEPLGNDVMFSYRATPP